VPRRAVSTAAVAGVIVAVVVILAAAYYFTMQRPRTLSISLIEYEFDGIPDQVAAGKYRLVVTNDGSEEHEIMLFKGGEDRLNQLLDDVNNLLSQLESQNVTDLTTIEEQVMDLAMSYNPVVHEELEPGDSATLDVNLEPGTYFVVCLVPEFEGGELTVHANEGMHKVFQVTG